MFKKIATILPYTSIIALLLVFFAPYAHAAATAETSVFSFLGFNFADLIAEGLANVVNNLQTIASWTLIIAGLLLNFSVDLTLHIKSFVDNTPGIYSTWRALRDITGLFIIFILLYASIKLILGFDAKFGDLIKNIVMAGILINFSFFFAGLGIDASNIISIQLYNAIAPANTITGSSVSSGGIESHLGDGGLSDIFMKSLRIPSLFTINGGLSNTGQAANAGGAITAPFKIILTGFTGIIIMITAALSFGAAAIAFIIRFVVLIFLLAFSPIWFASFIAPEIKKYAESWLSTYKSMLIFMPVYLLLMYFALTVLTTSPLLGNSGTAVTASAGSSGSGIGSLVGNAYAATIGSAGANTWWGSFVVLGINAVLVIVLLNMPLLAAIAIGGKAVSFINTSKLGAAGIWKGVGGYAGVRTAGKFASSADKYLGNTRIGNTLLGRDIRSATIGKVATSKMGSGRSYEDLTKAQGEVKRKGNEIDRRNRFNSAFSNVKNGIDLNVHAPLVKGAMNDMGEKERVSLAKDSLKSKDENGLNILVKHMKRSDFESINKSDDFSPEEKKAVSEARGNALVSAAKSGDADVVKDMLGSMNDDDKRNMSDKREEALNAAINSTAPGAEQTLKRIVNAMTGKDLMSLGAVTNPKVINYLKPAQLTEMEENGIETATKKTIGQAIKDWHTPAYTAFSGGATHRALSFLGNINDVNNPKNHWWN